MNNRVSVYPEDFWAKFGINIDTPDDKKIAEAYRTISSFPELDGQIEDMKQAIQVLHTAQNAQVNEKIVRRYGPVVKRLRQASAELMALMDEDIESAENL